MTFEVGRDTEQPKIQNDGMKYEGLRFRAECRLAGRLYGQPFGVDVAFGDPILGEIETVTVDDVLGFAGIAPPTVRLYPVETHIAEKLHAYTMPRARPNTRVKDLPGCRRNFRDACRKERASLRGTGVGARVYSGTGKRSYPRRASWRSICVFVSAGLLDMAEISYKSIAYIW